MNAKSVIPLQLWPEERALLLKYGYLWGPVRDSLSALVASSEIEVIEIRHGDLGRLIGDLCYSINKKTRGRVQAELSELCDRLEAAERWGDGMLDEF